jgi:hypothetical protein
VPTANPFNGSIRSAAAADFEAALRVDAKYAHAFYGRGLVRKQSGDTAGGEDDLAAAIALNPKVASDFAPYGFGK